MLFTKTFIQNHAFQKNFFFQIVLFKNISFFKSCVLEKTFSSLSCFLKLNVKRKTCAFYGAKWVKTWFFVRKGFSKICFLKIFFSSKSCFLEKIFSSLAIVLFEIERKTLKLRILRGKMSENVIFCAQRFFKNLLFKNIFLFKIMLFIKIFFFTIWRVVKSLIENLTRCKIFISKSDAL